jgi:hypothetical protein
MSCSLRFCNRLLSCLARLHLTNGRPLAAMHTSPMFHVFCLLCYGVPISESFLISQHIPYSLRGVLVSKNDLFVRDYHGRSTFGHVFNKCSVTELIQKYPFGTEQLYTPLFSRLLMLLMNRTAATRHRATSLP